MVYQRHICKKYILLMIRSSLCFRLNMRLLRFMKNLKNDLGLNHKKNKADNHENHEYQQTMISERYTFVSLIERKILLSNYHSNSTNNSDMLGMRRKQQKKFLLLLFPKIFFTPLSLRLTSYIINAGWNTMVFRYYFFPVHFIAHHLFTIRQKR